MIRNRLRLLIMVLLLGITAATPHFALYAQNTARYDVFFDPQAQEAYFVEASTGLSLLAPVTGSQHVLLPGGLLYQSTTGAAKLLTASGNERILTWLPAASAGSLVVRWVTTPDQRLIGWVVAQSMPVGMVNQFFTAETDGGELKTVTQIESAQGKIAYPLALSNDGLVLFYALQLPPNPNNYRVFFDALDVYALNTRSGESIHLPNEPLCPCGVGFSADGRTMARLQLEGDGSAFIVTVWDLVSNSSTVIPSIGNFTHTQAGEVVVSDDGNWIIYASARGTAPGRSERYALTLVDLARRSQELLTGALAEGVRPIAFTEDNKVVIVVGMSTGATYKLTLATRDLKQVSAYNWLGQLN